MHAAFSPNDIIATKNTENPFNNSSITCADSWLCSTFSYFEPVRTRREMKEVLYSKVYKLLQKGKMYEDSLEVAKELETHYESETFEYAKLSLLHEKMAKMYRDIVSKENIRMKPEYYR